MTLSHKSAELFHWNPMFVSTAQCCFRTSRQFSTSPSWRLVVSDLLISHHLFDTSIFVLTVRGTVDIANECVCVVVYAHNRG